jgi:hypothetical protein
MARHTLVRFRSVGYLHCFEMCSHDLVGSCDNPPLQFAPVPARGFEARIEENELAGLGAGGEIERHKILKA